MEVCSMAKGGTQHYTPLMCEGRSVCGVTDDKLRDCDDATNGGKCSEFNFAIKSCIKDDAPQPPEIQKIIGNT